MATDHPAQAALNELDRALAAKPYAEGHTFSEAARQLCLLRDRLAAEQSQTGATSETRRKLGHVNAVISVVLAGHFPLGDVPWAELAKARAWLEDFITADGQAAPAAAAPPP